MSDGVNRCALSIAWLKQNQGERRAKPFPSYTGIWSLRLPSYKRAQGLFHRTRAFGLFCSLPGFHRTRAFGLFCRHRRTKCCFLPAPPFTRRPPSCTVKRHEKHPTETCTERQCRPTLASRALAILTETNHTKRWTRIRD